MRITRITNFSLCTAVAFLVSGQALAGGMLPPVVPASSVPTLGEWGLAGIAALLAVAAGRALRNRKR